VTFESGRDEIPLPEEELVQVSVKRSLVGEEDLELILEGCLWFFQRQLIIFDKLTQYMERSKIRLVLLLFWLKMGPCLPECDKKDLMHVVGSTFGGVIRSEVKGEYCRLKVQLDMQKPLQKAIFISMEH
ncbi:hypothetical protein Gotri_014868, partial [Gossypium trilobum]|nr:hypothetical protein [Gossypium trilobum]